MKARPRRMENRVAEYLSQFFVSLGMKPVERIPILGREGPDITSNEVKLVVDVKSRLQVPKGPISIPMSEITLIGVNLVGIHLRDLPILLEKTEIGNSITGSLTVKIWYDHMSEFNDIPDGIPALVLHRPGLNTDRAVLIIHKDDLGRLHDRLNSFTSKTKSSVLRPVAVDQE